MKELLDNSFVVRRKTAREDGMRYVGWRTAFAPSLDGAERRGSAASFESAARAEQDRVEQPDADEWEVLTEAQALALDGVTS